jgi:peptidyl-tRNA hydrolase
MQDNPTPGLVQPIVIARTGSHEDAVRCAAEASLRAYLAAPDLPEWQDWLSGIFTKTVRRAKPAEYEKARAVGALAEVCHGGASALAFAPYPADNLPRPIARLQVSGTELERRGWGEEQDGAYAIVALNEDLGMSTGKAAAQAAHALWSAWLQLGERSRERWVADGLAFRLVGVPVEDIGLGQLLGIAPGEYGTDPVCRVYVNIHDAGLTEVEPGSLTAVGLVAR